MMSWQRRRATRVRPVVWRQNACRVFTANLGLLLCRRGRPWGLWRHTIFYSFSSSEEQNLIPLVEARHTSLSLRLTQSHVVSNVHPSTRASFYLPCCCGWVRASLLPVWWASSSHRTFSSRSNRRRRADTACSGVPTSTTGRSC